MKKITLLQFDEADTCNWAKEIDDAFGLCSSFCSEMHVTDDSEDHPVRRAFRTVTASKFATFSLVDALALHKYATAIVYNRITDAIADGSVANPEDVKLNAQRLVNVCKRFVTVCRNTLNTP